MTPGAKKRKMQESPVVAQQSPRTPPVGKSAKGGTPKSNKSTPKNGTPVQKTPKSQTPKQQSSLKSTPNTKKVIEKSPSTGQKNKKTPQSGKKHKGKASKVITTPDEDSDEDDEVQFKNGALFKGLLHDEEDDDSEDEDEEDDDSEDEEDDDSEEEVTIQPPSKKVKTAKTEIHDDEEDDDSEDEDEEGDDSEDDEEDDDSEEEVAIQPPSKKVKTAKTETPKVGTELKKEKAKSTVISNSASSVDVNRKKEMDARTLFVKNIPRNCTVTQIKSLSSDIKQVRLRLNSNTRKKHSQVSYAFLQFSSEADAVKNFKILQESKIAENLLIVDYVGEKSSFQPEKKTKIEYDDHDPLRLYISGIPLGINESDLRKLFPKASNIDLPKRKNNYMYGYGFVSFESSKLASQYHDECQGASLNGNTLVVLYAKKRKPEGSQVQVKKETQQKAKKTKAVPAINNDEEDMDDGDDDEDDAGDDDEDAGDDDEDADDDGDSDDDEDADDDEDDSDDDDDEDD